jgi:hypothetical protein
MGGDYDGAKRRRGGGGADRLSERGGKTRGRTWRDAASEDSYIR